MPGSGGHGGGPGLGPLVGAGGVKLSRTGVPVAGTHLARSHLTMAHLAMIHAAVIHGAVVSAAAGMNRRRSGESQARAQQKAGPKNK